MEEQNVNYYLSSVYEGDGGTGYTLVINPSINGAWNVYVPGDAPVKMVVGRAYWVVMQNPGTLVGFTPTPLE